MAYAILAFDGNDPSRRAAAMDRHRAVISRWAADGRMPFGTPLFTAEWVLLHTAFEGGHAHRAQGESSNRLLHLLNRLFT